VEDLYNYKRLIGEVLGAAIAVAWIAWALIWPGNMVGLVVAISITVLFGTLSGGLIALSTEKKDVKEIIGWVLGAAIAVPWVTWALLYPGDMVGLVVAIGITILFGTLSGGLITISQNKPKES
jgi:hypothetical protein